MNEHIKDILLDEVEQPNINTFHGDGYSITGDIAIQSFAMGIVRACGKLTHPIHAGRMFQHFGSEAKKEGWVDLTDQDRFEELQKMDPTTMRLPPGLKEFAEHIEKRIKEKNHV
jgi:hypothetical protein